MRFLSNPEKIPSAETIIIQDPVLAQIAKRCSNRPFWIWDEDQHKLADKVYGDNCCFNHIIGLPKKDGLEYPMQEYEYTVFDPLQNHKHLWIKKATGLGITEFMLRYMAWLAITRSKDANLNKREIFTIVTGPRIDLAIDLISRFKQVFENTMLGLFECL